MDCSGFTGSLTISGSVTSIASNAFANCSGFTGTLTIQEGVTSIEIGAFEDCSGFTGSLTIPSSVKSIGRDTFAGCSFASITVNNTEDAVTGAPWGWDGTVTWAGNAGTLNLTTADARKEEEFR